MKIVHLVAGLEEANGMALTVVRLAQEESAAGHEVVIVTASDDGCLTAGLKGVSVRVCPVLLKHLRFSFAFARGIGSACAGADVVHTHSAWTFPVWWGARCAKHHGAKLIVTPNGPYDPVRRAHHGGRKRLVAWLDRWALRAADAVHVISSAEQEWVHEFEPRVRRFVIAPLGVDRIEETERRTEGDAGTFLYLGRVHPLKGLDLLVEAWGKVRDAKWRMVVAGPDEQGTLAKLKERARQAGMEDGIAFCGAVYGEEKRKLMATCDVFVLPSRSENFGLVVAEALAAGKPVIVTDVIPWQGVREHRCGWVTPVTVDGLAAALRAAMATPKDELAAMGARGRDWMRRDFSWRVCAETILAAVRGIDEK